MPLFQYADPSSKSWQFSIYGSDYHPRCPEGWRQQVKFCVWIAYEREPRPGEFMGKKSIHGIVQFNNDRHMSLLGSRYSQAAHWRPLSMNDTHTVKWFMESPIHHAQRYIYGVPYHVDRTPVKTFRLPRLPDGIKYFDDLVMVASKELFEEDDKYFELLDGLTPEDIDFIPLPSQVNIDALLNDLTAEDFNYLLT